MRDLRHAAIGAVLQLISDLQIGRLAAPLTRGLGAGLMFHHVRPWAANPATPAGYAPNAILEITPAFLDETLGLLQDRGFEIIPIDEAPDRLAAPRKPPFAVLTFDDGYRDLLSHALPVLRRRKAPFTVFVTPGFADGLAPLWWRDLEDVVGRRSAVIARLGDAEVAFTTETAAQKTAAYRTILSALSAANWPILATEIARQAELSSLDRRATPTRLCMDWAELRALAEEPLCTIGAHTMTHPMLARLDAIEARNEMIESRRRLEYELQRDVRHFAYPVGGPQAAGTREFALAGVLGFRTAWTTRPGMLFGEHATALQALPRLSVNGLHQSRPALDALLSGLPFALANRGRRISLADG
jgi:peptidoglycan/xylan/chitin deacetylase (PgdA/CDA1 family)